MPIPKIFTAVIAIAAILALSAISFAGTFAESKVKFTQPSELIGNTEYDFEIMVTNAATQGAADAEWIYLVDLSMPSAAYGINQAGLSAPTPNHPTEIDRWEVSYDATRNALTWECFPKLSISSVGDIRENESLRFNFTAITDGSGKDGFDWTLTGDKQTLVAGTAYVTGGDDDDDTGGDDDDDSGSDDDDDFFNDDDDDTIDEDNYDTDDDSSGCGC